MIRVNAPKPAGISAGSAKAGKPNVYIALLDDIDQFPGRDSKGVKMTGNITFKPGKGWNYVYMTPSKQNRSWESDGDEDAISITQKFVGTHPGDALESAEFVQQWLGQNVIVAVDFCDGSLPQVIGTPCAPLQLKPTFTADADSTGFEMEFSAYAKTNMVPGYYQGVFTTTDPFAVADNEAVAIATADGYVYKLNANNGKTIVVASIAVDEGSIITFIGNGSGTTDTLPAAANVLLKGGTSWLALDGAKINFIVVNSKLVEISRS